MSIRSDLSMIKIKDYLNITEAAAFIGVTKNTLRNWEKDKKITVRRNRLNKYRMYKKEDLEKILSDINKVEP